MLPGSFARMSTAEEQKAIVEQYHQQHERATARMGPIYKTQELLLKDRGASGPIWVSRAQVSAPSEPDLRDQLIKTFRQLGDGHETIDDVHYASHIHTEWTGRRAGVTDPKAPGPKIPEAEKFQQLLRDAGESPTVLYVFGGGFIAGGTITARPVVKRLSAFSNAKFVTFNYRLAPQWTMPSPLLDLLVVYFSLLAPPPGSLHTATPAHRIVLAAESCGATLALDLIQVLLQLQRNGTTTIRFHGRDVPIDLPAGATMLSVPADMTHSLPSAFTNPTDWLSDPSFSLPFYQQDWPPEPFWPADPPRGPIFCEWNAVMHPFNSVVTTKDWTGSPPLWFATGTAECMFDSARIVACTAAKQGVAVRWEEYEGMTHVFPLVMPQLPQSARLMKSWAIACETLGNGRRVMGGGVHVGLGELRERSLNVQDVKGLIELTPADAKRMALEGKIAQRGHLVVSGVPEVVQEVEYRARLEREARGQTKARL